ncbi:hypothetical protein CKA32_006465 [Geitlerinema sp. FC II]|nr:hypothetical protein CKA32_006465 [Geitlerinema sp. FC II]
MFAALGRRSRIGHNVSLNLPTAIGQVGEGASEPFHLTDSSQ